MKMCIDKLDILRTNPDLVRALRTKRPCCRGDLGLIGSAAELSHI